MKVGRNEPCPCGSGKKYKHCCLSKERTLLVRPSNNPENINSHAVSSNGGKTWHKVPGLLATIIGAKNSEDLDERVENNFSEILRLVNELRMDNLSKKLHDCKHKLYAVRYHLKTIEREIDKKVAEFKKEYSAGSGASFELENPVLIYETEAFLFQVKSNIDLLIQALSSAVPSLKSFITFKHSGDRATNDYVAGGKVIKELIKSGEHGLVHLFETHRTTWIQQMTLMRDTITHYSGLRDFHCFIEEPYRGGDQVKIHYPTMPSGKRVDTYCQETFNQLCDLCLNVLNRIRQHIQGA